MQDIQDAGISQGLVRRLNIVDVVPAPSLAPEVFPVYQVAPPSQEDDLLRGVFLCAGGAVQAATPAEYSLFRLANLAGSGLLVMVDRIILTVTADTDLVWGLGTVTTLLANQRPTGIRDSRITPIPAGQQTSAILSSNTSITVPLVLTGKRDAYIFAPGAAILTFDVQSILEPGTSFDLGALTANIGIYLTVFWRERRAQPAELV